MKPRVRRGRRYTLATAALAAAMMLGIFLLLRLWPFGDGTVLTGDLNGLYVNFYGHLRRALLGEAGFAYGFDKGLGGNLVGLYATYYAGPLNLLAALAPLRWLPVAVAGLQLARVVLACVFCRVFLGARFPALGWGSVALALCYGFCAYSFAYAQNPMWLDVLLLLPLICLGLEWVAGWQGAQGTRGNGPAGESIAPVGAPAGAAKGCQNKAPQGFALYTGALALAIWCNFYTAYMVCIFSILYFLYIMLLRPRARRAAAGWHGPLARFAAGSALAGGLNAALLLPTLANVGQAKGGLLAFSFSLGRQFPLGQLAERLALGAIVDGDMTGHLPFVYCGALVLVLAGCFFFSRRLRLGEKLAAGAMLLLFLLSFWLEGPDTLWHGLKAPVGFPARYAFIFSFFLVRLAAQALARGAANRRTLAVAGTFWLAAFALMAAFPARISPSRLLLTGLLAAGYAVILMVADSSFSSRAALARVPAAGRRSAAGTESPPGSGPAGKLKGFSPGGVLLHRILPFVLLALVAGELVLNGWYTMDRFEKYPLSTYRAFVDEKGGAVAAIQAADGGDYRTAEDDFRSLNDPMLLGYRGLSHFASTQDGDAQGLLYALGYRVYGGGGPYLYGNTAFADSVLGLKYLLATGARPAPAHWRPGEGALAPADGFYSAAVNATDASHPENAGQGEAEAGSGGTGAVAVYENPYALPMAFTITPPADAEAAALPLNAAGNDDPFAAQAALYALLGGEGPLWGAAPQVSLGQTTAEADGAEWLVPSYGVTAAEAGYHYALLQLPEGTTIALQGKAQPDPYNTALNAGVVDLGWLEAGETALIGVFAEGNVLDAGAVWAVCLPAGRLEALADYAAQGAGDLTLTDGRLTGTVAAEAGRTLLYTSIPWAEGWAAEVNGAAVAPRRLAGGLLAVPLQPGMNTVDLKYTPPGGGPAGWAVTGGSALLFAAALAWQGRRGRGAPKEEAP